MFERVHVTYHVAEALVDIIHDCPCQGRYRTEVVESRQSQEPFETLAEALAEAERMAGERKSAPFRVKGHSMFPEDWGATQMIPSECGESVRIEHSGRGLELRYAVYPVREVLEATACATLEVA